VLVGIESLNQASLDTINKHQKISDIERCAAALSRHKIRLIASLVLGIDTDGPEDIRRGVQFARKIHAYQLQPAVLTPFPGTPVYEQYCSEKRMIIDDWQCYDMMSVTFIPKKMTPWELQEEFFSAIKSFYNYRDPFAIGRIFGANYGLRRFGFALVVHLGVAGAHLCSKINNGNIYNRLRRYNEEPAPQHRPRRRQLRKTTA
jgi:radical SAM superfamily enzyme YgiQ (UPF0313 family)